MLPQLDPAIFPTQIFWSVVSFTLLYLMMHWLLTPLVQLIRQREQKVADDHAEAEQLMQKVARAIQEYEDAMRQAREDMTALQQQEKDKLQEELDKLNEDFANRLNQQTAEAEAELAQIHAQATAQAQSIAADILPVLLARYDLPVALAQQQTALKDNVTKAG